MGLLPGVATHVTVQMTLDARPELALIAREPFATLAHLWLGCMRLEMPAEK